MHSESNGTKSMKHHWPFWKGNGSSLLDLASLTLHYKSIKQTPIQFTFQTNNHSNKFTHTRQWKPIHAWEHAQDSFILQGVSMGFLNFVRSKLVIYQSGKVISKRVLSKTVFKSIHHFMWWKMFLLRQNS